MVGQQQAERAASTKQQARNDLEARYKSIAIPAVNAALSCRPKKQETQVGQHPLYESREES